MKTLTTYVALDAAGVPVGSTMAGLMQASADDYSKVTEVFSGFNAITTLFEFAATAKISWFYSKTRPGEFPLAFLMQGNDENANSVVLTLWFNQDILEGNQQAAVFSIGEQSCYQVATLSMTVRLGGEDAYVMVARVGVSTSDVASDQFNTVDWEATLSSVVPRMVEGINQQYLPQEVAAGDPGAPSIHPGLWLACQVSTPVNIAVTVIKVLKLAVTIVKHSSAFQWLIPNFSSSVLTVRDTFSYDAGVTSYSDTLGQSTLAPLSPAKTVELPGGYSIELVQFSCVSQVSASELKGTGLALTLQLDDSQQGATLVNIPWAGENKVHADAGYPQSAEDYWEQQSGVSSGNTQTAIFTDGTQMGISIDALTGKQPQSDGELAYFYNVILTVA